MNADFFLSYSRRQFYFAEALIRRLDAEGFTIWFDIDRLRPGLAWSESIRQGLEQSNRLLLIASQAAMASRHVEQEWKTALENGKPIYIVVFEAVELPSELERTAAVIVFKGNVSAVVRRLVDAIRSGRLPHDPLPKLSALALLTRLPRAVLLVALALLGSGLLVAIPVIGMAVDQIYIFPDGRIEGVFSFVGIAIYVLSYGLLAGWFFYQGWRFLRRDVSYYQMRFALPFVPLISGVVYVLWYLITVVTLKSSILVPPGVFWVIFGVIGLLDLYIFFKTTRASEDVYYWLPTGEAPVRLRERYEWYPGSAIRRPTKQRSVTYRLHYAPTDQALAADIRDMMRLQSHRELDGAGRDEPDFDLIILSNQTPQNLVSSVLRSRSRPISIVASRIAIPESISQLANYQWVDYRKRSAGQLRALAAYMSEEDPGALPPGLRALPETLNKPVAPPRVTTVANILRITSAVYLLIFALILVSPFNPTRTIPPLQLYATLLVLLGQIILNIWLMGALLDRRIALETFTNIMIASYAIGGVMLLFNGDPLSRKIFTGISALVGAYIYYRLFYPQLRDWLPRRAKQTATATLETGGLLGASFRNVMGTTFGIALFFIGVGRLYLSPSNNLLPPKARFAGKLAFASAQSDSQNAPRQLYIMQGSTLDARWLTRGPDDAHAPEWSPDRSQIAFLSGQRYGQSDLHVVHADGTNRRLIAQSAESFSWSPDGRQIALTIGAGNTSKIYRSAVDRPQPQVLADLPGAVERKLAWSPDGRQIAFYQDPSIYLVNIDGTNLRQLATLDSNTIAVGSKLEDIPIFAWSPTGDRLAYLDGLDVIVAMVDGPSERRVIVSLKTIDNVAATQTLVWSPDGRQIAFVAAPKSGKPLVYTVGPDGANLHRIFTGERFGDLGLAWSPDSAELALSDGRDIYVVDANGSRLRQLTNNRGRWIGSELPTW